MAAHSYPTHGGASAGDRLAGTGPVGGRLALFSQTAGALLLARAVASTDPDLSDQVLAAAREDLRARAHQH
ncbi:hypothetical protein ACIRYZ_45055 [Kitasatospora sp. NPDC101155]|uniref:hypothetical protein n=1 Tax=Kitasatospora sp. NPDC101155 TaxID=3364097 RepID=UPI00382C3EB3